MQPRFGLRSHHPHWTLLAITVSLTMLSLVAGCGSRGGAGPPEEGPIVEDPGPLHVHGLGINPADGALYLATHTGLFRIPEGSSDPTRVADRWQDTMGFKVVGADNFLGSGHPDGREGKPPLLGLIESGDAGETWSDISLSGEADFHVLETAGDRIYGFDATNSRLMVGADGGGAWTELEVPEPLIALAIDPDDSDRLVASGAEGLYRSTDAAASWQDLRGNPGLLEWSEGGQLLLAEPSGAISRSSDGGVSFEAVGTLDGAPVAFDASAGDVHAALEDGRVFRSADGGATWALRYEP